MQRYAPCSHALLGTTYGMIAKEDGEYYAAEEVDPVIAKLAGALQLVYPAIDEGLERADLAETIDEALRAAGIERNTTGVLTLEQENALLRKQLAEFYEIARDLHARAAVPEACDEYHAWLVEVHSERLYEAAGLNNE